MEFGEIISYVLTALGGGGLSGFIFWRLNRRQKEAEVKNQEIENINDIVEKVYKPMIDTLNERVTALDAEVRSLREERRAAAERHEAEISAIKKDCAEKSEAMRKQTPELAGEQEQKADRQARAKNGQFTNKN